MGSKTKCSESFYDCLGGKHRSGNVSVTFSPPHGPSETWRLVQGRANAPDEKSLTDIRKIAAKHAGAFHLVFQGVSLPLDPENCKSRKYREAFDPVKAREVLGDKYRAWLETTVGLLPVFPGESLTYSRKVASEFIGECSVAGISGRIRRYPGLLAVGPKALLDEHAYGNPGVLGSVVLTMAGMVDRGSKDLKRDIERFLEYYSAMPPRRHPVYEPVLVLASRLGLVDLGGPVEASVADVAAMWGKFEKLERDLGIPGLCATLAVRGHPAGPRDFAAPSAGRFAYGYPRSPDTTPSRNPFEISGVDRSSDDGRELGINYVHALVAAGQPETPEAETYSIDYVDDLLYRVLKGDAAAKEEYDGLVKRGEELVNQAREELLTKQKEAKPRTTIDPEVQGYVDIGTVLDGPRYDENKDRVYLNIGEMGFEDLFAVHETQFDVGQDENGNFVLKPHGDHTGSSRHTVHVGLNHRVLGHMERSGKKAKRAVIFNMKEFEELNPGSIDTLYGVDTILTPAVGRGLVLPKSTQIVTYDSDDNEDRNERVVEGLQKAGARFSFVGRGGTDSLVDDEADERIRQIASEKGLIFAHATNHPMYHHELRTRCNSEGRQLAIGYEFGPLIARTTSPNDAKGAVGTFTVDAEDIAKLSPNGRSRLFSKDMWVKRDFTPRPQDTQPSTPAEPGEQHVWSHADRLVEHGLMKARERRTAEFQGAQASCEQRAALARDVLVERHGLVRSATSVEVSHNYGLIDHDSGRGWDARVGVPAYIAVETDDDVSHVPKATFTMVGETADGRVMSYESMDSDYSGVKLFSAEDSLNVVWHPSIPDALRGTRITNSPDYERLVDLMSAIVENASNEQGHDHVSMVNRFDEYVLSNGDSDDMRESRGALLASMLDRMN